MTLTLNNLKAKKGAKHTSKRLGRGNASGKGTYSSRGLKGQRSRSGGKKGLKLKGFKQNLLSFPKFKGMKSHRPATQEVSLTDINSAFSAGDMVTPQTLMAKGLILNAQKPVKILNNGVITVKIEVSNVAVTAGAAEAIAKAGGKVVAIEKTAAKPKKEKAKTK